MDLNGRNGTQSTEMAKSTVRISRSLSDGERKSIASRQEVVKNGLAKLGISCQENATPNIAVLASGGALRAMIALYGTLSEMKKYNLLDCMMYLAGVSGSTWGMSTLYKTEDWAEKIEQLEKRQCEDLLQHDLDLKLAKEAVSEAAKDENFSLTDYWSFFIVHKLLSEMDQSKLSAQRSSCENGKNPYPLYAAVDKDTYENQNPATWFEFTPHEAGIPGLGVYIDMKYFGSIFQKGQLKEKKEEKTICYMQGLWGSALGSEKEIFDTIKESLLSLVSDEKSKDTSTGADDQSTIRRAFQPVLGLVSKAGEEYFDNLEKILKFSKELQKSWSSSSAEARKKASLLVEKTLVKDIGGKVAEVVGIAPSDTESSGSTNGSSSGKRSLGLVDGGWHFLNNVVKKTSINLLSWNWGCTNNFIYHCSDVKLPELTNKDVISLIDAGLAINTAYPLILRPERNVKLILSFDYSAGDPFETIKKTAQYCKDYKIPFPEINEKELQDSDNLSDCYIFRGKGVPTVMHFPLFNKVNCPGKIAEYRDKYSTFKKRYTEEEIKELLTAAKKNVANVHQKILEEIKKIGCPVSHKA